MYICIYDFKKLRFSLLIGYDAQYQIIYSCTILHSCDQKRRYYDQMCVDFYLIS